MGSVSAKKLAQVVENTANAIAIEVLVASAGIDQRKPLRPSRGVAAAHGAVRKHVAQLVEDRPLYKDIGALREMIRSGELLRAVEASVGPLG